jgi:hypothetical protein
LKHCKETHNFDLIKLKKDWNLDLYATIKLVNYVRQQVMHLRYISVFNNIFKVINKICPNCELFFPTGEDLLKHLNDTNHFKVQRSSYFWNDAK